MAIEDSKHFRETRPALFVFIKYLKRNRIYTKFVRNYFSYHQKSLLHRWDEDFESDVLSYHVNTHSESFSFIWALTKEGQDFWNKHIDNYRDVLEKLEALKT